MAKRILLVDDEPLIIKGLKYTLEQEGFETDSAADGEEALAKFFAGSYDFILLDVMLPKLDGITVCQRIREHSNVPIIMDAYQPTDRFYVRSSVYLPNSDVDPRTGMLRQGAHRAGRTQALRMEAQRLDQEYARMDAALQSRREEKGLRVNLRTAMMMTFALLVAFALMLLTQQGVLDQYARRVKAVDQKNAVLQTNIQDLQGQIAEASDQATICYAAARNIGMRICPASTLIEPQMRLRRLVFPLPLLPITLTNCPSGIERLKSRKRQVSFTLPGLYTLVTLQSSSMKFYLLPARAGKSQNHQEQRGGYKFQILRNQTHVQKTHSRA